jgi:hypothetical protein
MSRFELVRSRRGAVRVSGWARYDPARGTRLVFEFDLDQTFLAPLARELRGALDRLYPARKK